MAFILDYDAVLFNNAFTKVLYTGKQQQYVAKALKPGENIGMEAHQNASQTVIVVDGRGLARLGDETEVITPGKAVLVEPGTDHDFIADESSWLRILVIYSPPLHPKKEYVINKPSGEESSHKPAKPSTKSLSPKLKQAEEQPKEEVPMVYGDEYTTDGSVVEEEEEESSF